VSLDAEIHADNGLVFANWRDPVRDTAADLTLPSKRSGPRIFTQCCADAWVAELIATIICVVNRAGRIHQVNLFSRASACFQTYRPLSEALVISMG
jgi:hypothetical protein